MKKSHIIISLFLCWIVSSAQMCTKVMVYGKNTSTSPFTVLYAGDKPTLSAAVKKALESTGYEIQSEDDENGKFVTGWKPVEVDSHYFSLFNRRDYGTSDGAYYQLNIDMIEEGSKIKILASTTCKSIVGKLSSSGKVEKRVLKQIDDYLRSPQIEITNVGLERK